MIYENFLVSQDWHLSKLWYVSRQRHEVSATVWETDTSLGFHRTAKAAREALEARQAGKLTAWRKTIGRGCATYRVQNYTGPVLDGNGLAKATEHSEAICRIEARRAANA